MRRQVDRKKGQYRNQGRSQQRHGSARHGIQYSFSLSHAPLHVHQCGIVHHNGIVHQHTHGNDNGCQRHTLQGYAGKLHVNQRTENGEYQSTANQDSILEADKEQQYGHHGQDRKNQIPHKSLVGHSRFVPLVIDNIQIISVRHFLTQV